jgi:DNA-binding transcriptional ArsR family regulator
MADYTRLLRYFKALSNDTRLRILGLVAEQELNREALNRRLGLADASLSHHLSMLLQAGIINERMAGATRLYSLNKKAFWESSRLQGLWIRQLQATPDHGAEGACGNEHQQQSGGARQRDAMVWTNLAGIKK